MCQKCTQGIKKRITELELELEAVTLERDLLRKRIGEMAEEGMEEKTCRWLLDHGMEVYDTGCGESFILLEGTLIENEIRFCAYCGGRIQQEAQ